MPRLRILPQPDPPGFLDAFMESLAGRIPEAAAEYEEGQRRDLGLALAYPHLRKGQAPENVTAQEALQTVEPVKTFRPVRQPRRPGELDPLTGTFTPPIDPALEPPAPYMAPPEGQELLERGLDAMRQSTGPDRYRQLTPEYYEDIEARPENVERRERIRQEIDARDRTTRAILALGLEPEDERIALALRDIPSAAGGAITSALERREKTQSQEAAFAELQRLDPERHAEPIPGYDYLEELEAVHGAGREREEIEFREQTEAAYRAPREIPAPIDFESALERVMALHKKVTLDQQSGEKVESYDVPIQQMESEAWGMVERAGRRGGGRIMSPLGGALPGLSGGQQYGAPREGGRRTHEGIDLAAPKGTPALAPIDSTVMDTGTDSRLGHYVRLRDANGRIHTLGHLAAESPLRQGMAVQAGQSVGAVGDSGNAQGAHIHWSVTDQDGDSLDPATLFAEPPGPLPPGIRSHMGIAPGTPPRGRLAQSLAAAASGDEDEPPPTATLRTQQAEYDDAARVMHQDGLTDDEIRAQIGPRP